jgi:hypothetical protein
VLQIYFEFAYKNSAKDGSKVGIGVLEGVGDIYELGESMIVNLDSML